ncbi:Predicted flavoprotein CzcO associated with the cation diffusion facilitator CzcD [Nocardia farcinica]|uniref:4-hydroxyacetophenone monooxygenase n=1 Tax=Nocardia farcinica TaxID=37329 RepID=A0A0H5P5Q4_NOCFR|nr:NAD(P)/FAD-dependent oxidoreductase [Nocardia farcinica]AXK85858.1 NAD(P)/FAD-dependent oxidoreductase [Nocardia farcinica]MBA4859206.1 NAD(P)/FAD-dependent oxidoreductase [Nocardia farcinica]MBC9819012.1 NAD(P)/FAD-dependent oxidoreductase [Nocardia farcinica]PFW98754.1 Baeyer-Villiger monooxygenase [Nocardia farcinica]PFX04375.1 Baeyer-Villiger monooxygenase [Nocardia farcinica]
MTPKNRGGQRATPEKAIPDTGTPDYRIAVIGAGPGGICAGARLLQRGLTDFVILERAQGFGGSWRDNNYPGLGVDVPGFTYQYSFARNPNWARVFPKREEVLAYHEAVADRFGLAAHTRFGVNVVQQIWDDQRRWWRLVTDDGSEITARFLISAVGAYIHPKQDPGIPGYQDFRGKVLRPIGWDHDYDLAGKRVAVIGTGASSVQITPSIAPEVGSLQVYQRTPVWCLPKPDFAVPAWLQTVLALPGAGPLLSGMANLLVDLALRLIVFTPAALFRPGARGFDALARALYRGYLRTQVRDPRVRRDLMPTYGALGKRPTLSNDYVQTFNRSNVELVVAPIERITESGIRTVDGSEHQLDAIVLATGYELFSDPESYREGAIVGRDGFDLGRFYAENRLQAYESVAVPGLPNRWMLVGPYSWIGTGWHELVEIGTDHAVNVIAEAERLGCDVVEVAPEAHERYHKMIRRQGRNIAYYFQVINAGLRTYYVNSQGDMPYIRPTSLMSARKASRRTRFDDYRFGRRAATSQAPEAASEKAMAVTR